MSKSLYDDLSDESISTDNETLSPVLKRFKCLDDLSAENSPEGYQDDSLFITHSQSTRCLSPKSTNNVSDLEKSILALSTLLQVLTNNVSRITGNMATKSDLASTNSRLDLLETNTSRASDASLFTTGNVLKKAKVDLKPTGQEDKDLIDVQLLSIQTSLCENVEKPNKNAERIAIACEGIYNRVKTGNAYWKSIADYMDIKI